MDQGRARTLTTVLVACAFAASVPSFADDEEGIPVSFSASALYWNGGEIRATRDHAPTRRPYLNPDLVLKLATDVGILEHFAVGISAAAAAPRDGFRPAFAQASVAWRFPFEVSREVAIEPALETGWRMLQEDYDSLGRVHGFAFDAVVRLAVDKDIGVVPFAEFGFLSQPWGGRDDLSVVFTPTMFVGGGLRF